MPGMALWAVAVLCLSACATTRQSTTAVETTGGAATEGSISQTTNAAEPDESAASAVDERGMSSITLGSGTFVQSASAQGPSVYADEDGVTLNFEQADLREFLRVVFESILQENYLIEDQVRGTVTLHTTRPVTVAAVMPIVEAVLESNGAAVVRDDGVYKVVPIANAEFSASAPSVGRIRSGSTAYGTQVVPLEHVSAREMETVLRPFVGEGSSLRADPTRNVMIISGPRYRVDELLATLRTFDVDWLGGMSFGIFRLQYADAATLAEELGAIVGGGEGAGPLADIVQIMPVERLNALLVIAHRPEHIERLRALIDEFDWGVEGSSGRRLYVYELENGKAENIAASLQQIFGVTGDQAQAGLFGPVGTDVFRTAEALTMPPPNPGPDLAVADGALPEDGFFAESSSEIKIIADVDNNAILVLANQQDYRSIEAAIRRLDIAPRQVLIEATIAEVSLSDTLTYGVRWFLQTSNGGRGFNAPVPTAAEGDGLALAFFDDDHDLSAFFDLLGTESSVKFLSTPQVMVLDNQTANIRVGDQIPVTTRSSQSTTNPDAPIVTEVQFRDTGTLLTVTPRINAGGQVSLEISQEVSLPGTSPAVGGGGNVSIAQRTINSSVIVQSGQTVVLGGLILETTNEGRSGIPVLMNIPVLGKLFSTLSEDTFRTELIVTVTPRVIENPRAIQQVTEELRERMRNATAYQNAVTERDGG